MDHKSHATPDGTSSFASDADLAEVGYARLGRTDLVVSRLGFGGYRVDDRAADHEDALTAALLSGVNLVDTSTNYTDGHSESLVGKVLSKLFAANKLRREHVVVVSKFGYVQGENLKLARERDAEGKPLPELVRFAEDCWHCLHPEFVKDQLGRSLSRLGLSTVDVYLLHNPEYFLVDAKKHRKDAKLEDVRAQFEARLAKTFEALEAEWEAGRLLWYGVSSNTFAAPADEREATSLTRMIELAREAAKARGRDPSSHRFAVAQLPLNLFENASFLAKKDGPGGDRTVLEHAKAEDLGVLANRPLNAFVKERLVRLAEPPSVKSDVPLEDAAEEVAAMEAIFAQDFAPRIKVEGNGPRPEQLFRWGTELADAPKKISGLDHWYALQGQVIGPQTNGALKVLAQGFKGDVAFEAWQKRYVTALEKLLHAVTATLVTALREGALKLKGELSAPLPEPWQKATLSRIAIATLLGVPGVTSVLVGMRRRAYVEDALGAVGLPPLPPEKTKTLLTALKVR